MATIEAVEEQSPDSTEARADDNDNHESQAKEEEKQDKKDDEEQNDDDDDDDLEEGELKDDDDDDDDDVDDDEELDTSSKRLLNYNNDNNSNGGLTKEALFADHRRQHNDQQIYPSPHLGPGGGGQAPHPYHQHNHVNRRHLSPEGPPHPLDMHGPYNPNHYGSNSNANHYRYPPNHEGAGLPMPPHMGAHPLPGPPPIGAYPPRGGPGPGSVGPMPKVNARCRFYSKNGNKCTWGDHCRFEHRDDSPGPEFDNRLPGLGPGGPSVRGGGPPPLPMGPAERPYHPYASRHQPYHPPPHHHGYGPPYEQAYGPHYHHSTPPPLPPHSVPTNHWRQHSPYPSPSSSAHPAEPVSPVHHSTPGSGTGGPTAVAPGKGPSLPPTIGSSSGASDSGGIPPGGTSPPGYPSPSSSVMYERKHRLAYEVAPWNDRGGYPPGKYDRGDPSGYPPMAGRGAFYSRSHYSRELGGREPPPPPHHLSSGAHPYPGGYPSNYPPAAYRGSPQRSNPSSHYKFMNTSRRSLPTDARRSRSNKRGHDEDESSWSDSGSEDSILGQASYSNKGNPNKMSKKRQPTSLADEPSEDLHPQGSGTPPGEPLSEDKERKEMLLNKLKEIEDLMAKKKGQQDDPM